MDKERSGGAGVAAERTLGGAHSSLNAARESGSDTCGGSVAALARVRVVLCRPRHPGNIGAVARALKTMGLSRLHLVSPERYAGEDERAEALARASGAGDVLAAATLCDSLDSALTGVVCAAAVTARVREIAPPRFAGREAAPLLVAHAARGGEVALVFGSETAGLTNDEVMRCDLCVSLPANPAYSSLNLGAAVQVLCYELRLAAIGAAEPAAPEVREVLSPLATRDEVERLMAHLEAVMGATGFFDAGNPKRLMPKLRRLFGRAALERDEVNILRGFLASVEDFRRK